MLAGSGGDWSASFRTPGTREAHRFSRGRGWSVTGATTGSGEDRAYSAPKPTVPGSLIDYDKTYTLLGADRRPYQSTVKGILGGHKGDRIYGRLDCPAAARAISKGGYIANRVFFADEATATAAGYRPCAACLPKKYAAWRASRDGRDPKRS